MPYEIMITLIKRREEAHLKGISPLQLVYIRKKSVKSIEDESHLQAHLRHQKILMTIRKMKFHNENQSQLKVIEVFRVQFLRKTIQAP